jgi:hypothetical protein
MTTRLERLTRPLPGATASERTRRRKLGYALAVIGLMAAMVSGVANLVAADQVASGAAPDAASTLAWSFGLNTAAFGTIKLAIAVVLTGILVRLWNRVESVRDTLPGLRAQAEPKILTGRVTTAYGPAEGGATVPQPLPIHTMAKRMWAPMLIMGYMAVIVGLLTSFAWADDPSSVALASWTQGLQFLGEGLLLAGISFLLGTILASLREGGGEVQEAPGLTVKTLKMPGTAKAFVALMGLGVMISVAQFVLYLVVAAGGPGPAVWFAWLGPLREAGLGILLSGVVLVLVTIGNVLGFQFSRITEIITTGN